MTRDILTAKIFYVISHSKEPITVSGIKIALRSKDVTNAMITARLVSLVISGKVQRGIMTIDGKQFTVYRERK